MNLAIIGSDENPNLKTGSITAPHQLIKVGGEYLVERIIRIAKKNRIDKVFCIINSCEQELKDFLSSTDFGIPLKLLVKDTFSFMHGLLELAPLIKNAPFCITTSNSLFLESDFAEFINYSLLQEGIDGVISITSNPDDDKPLSVSLNDEDTILKFSDTKEGYNWAAGGIYYFLPGIFDQVEQALQIGISRLGNFSRLLLEHKFLFKGFSISKVTSIEDLANIEKSNPGTIISGNQSHI
ncbi:MAG: hypothetical protein C4539_09670 [Ignavibacteriales bacterium]|nr:MAG: hypothetical protein C4539_09670 [Ignavibacteriales bacterium]